MRTRGALRFPTCSRGTSAVEFALVLPILAALIIGGIYTGLVVYSAAGLQTAVEQAARCYALGVTGCTSASATQTFAAGQYSGLDTPTFTASTPSCGRQVAASVTISFNAVVTNLSIPLSATSCYPTGLGS
jgi:Flp pilus assembly protein TadG